MFAIDSINSAKQILASIFKARMASNETTEMGSVFRGPVGLFLIREDGANGSKLAKEVMSSFEYWNSRTGDLI